MFNDLTTTVLTRAMFGGSARQQVIAQNIANADTPGYRRLSVDFEGALADALESDRAAMAMQRSAEAAGDTGSEWWDRRGGEPMGGRVMETRQVEPQTTRITGTVVRVDGSNVDPDHEMSELAANQLAYNTATSLLVARFGQMRNVITGQ